ncbi:Esterase (fragment) [metagenome]|uniref:Esterase n=1 Tax=metagenome TaxID=256318 RepID=A0A2P2C4C3_9ZZZZ
MNLRGNVAEIGRRLARRRGPVFLVGHSGGGATVTAAGQRYAHRVTGAVYVAGMMLPSGVGFAQLCGEVTSSIDGVVPHLRRTRDRLGTTVPREAGAALFFQRAGADDAIAASRRLSPQLDSGLALVPRWTADKFGRIPRLYIEARHDRAVPLTLQRHMQRRSPGASVVTLASDHCPQLSATDRLTDSLVDFMLAQ